MGSTGEIANFIGKILIQKNYDVEIMSVKNATELMTDLKTYKAVIIGSPIQYDNWVREVRQFAKNNRKSLSELPVAYFFSCLALSQQSKKPKEAKLKGLVYSNTLRSLLPEVNPVSVGGFAGVLDYSKMPFLPRIVFKAIMPILGVKEADYRNWSAINEWAENVHTKFNCGSTDQENINSRRM